MTLYVKIDLNCNGILGVLLFIVSYASLSKIQQEFICTPVGYAVFPSLASVFNKVENVQKCYLKDFQCHSILVNRG